MSNRSNYQIKEIAYIIMASISLVMYIFGHSTEAGTLPFPDKLFYFPCAITLIIAFSSRNYWHFNKQDKVFSIFLILTFLSSIAIGGVIWLHLVSCILGFLIFRHLKNVDISLLVETLIFLTPFVMAIHYFFTDPFSYSSGNRYGGFQGDPNCFSMAMNILIYSSGYTILHTKHPFKRIIAYLNIAGIIPLIFASASRSGVVCLLILLGISLFSSIRKHIFATTILLLGALILGSSYISIFKNQIDNSFNRLSNLNESDAVSSNYRLQEFEIAYDLLSQNPEFMLLGIGFSQTMNAHMKFPKQYYHGGRAHNTYMSVLMEQGVFGLILFLWFLYLIGITIWRKRHLDDGWMRVTLFGALLLFIFTIFSLPFLPFWFALYLSQNYSVSHV